jgi:predicted nucleic acid-binding protein
MPKIVIADTSCLIVLDKIDLLHILPAIYKEIYITPEIALEYSRTLPNWIKIQHVLNQKTQKELEVKLDEGEASAIALALELGDCLLILDDLQGRKVANDLHLDFTGTLGVLVRAKKSGYITAIEPVLEKLKSIKFRISADVEQDILMQCNEL